MDKLHKFRFQAPAQCDPVRIDVFLANQNLKLSRTVAQRLIKTGCVHINGRPVKSSDKILPNQICECKIPDQVLNPPTHLVPHELDLQVLFEDEHMLAVNKPASISVHPGASEKSPTLAHGLVARAHALSDLGGWDRPGIVHRLDKDTSGVLLVAKNNYVHALLSRQFSDRKIRKEYWALAWGTFVQKQTMIQAPVGRHLHDRKKMTVVEKGRPALTRFSVTKEYAFCSEVKAFPQTGRTHQIRVHLAHIGHPVVGDAVYGGNQKRLGAVPPLHRLAAAQLVKLAKRQMLHARRIQFVHPITGKKMELAAEFPQDIDQIRGFLESLRIS